MKKWLTSACMAICLAIGLVVSAAHLNNYTELPTRFEVKKAIVVEGEQCINKSYVLSIDLGTLYQGESNTELINITNRASVNLTIDVMCDKITLVYKSGYKLSKSPENASKDWGINVTTPGKLTIPAKGTIAVEIGISASPNAQIASEESEKYDHYEAEIYVRAVA
ncbi:MAG: hypothetical protein QMD21_02020 [Candidatus Thermoplasmatota archaeon]|nr:hypothetical protein [Candidatus Thermoplasmatota archaeon]MDI6887548.1 hypothetical protein [Candidatus Thermoplasmatota archaeon]